MIDLSTIFERCLSLRASVSHPGFPLDTAALEQFNLVLVRMRYVKNPYAAPGVYLPSGLWVEGGQFWLVIFFELFRSEDTFNKVGPEGNKGK